MDHTQNNVTSPPPSQSWLAFMFSPSGRIPRKRYWLSYVVPVVILYVLAWMADLTILTTAKAQGEPAPAFVGAAVWLFLFWPSFAVTIKRLHDLGTTGWWSIIANGFVPITVLAVAAYWYYTARMKPGGAPPMDPNTQYLAILAAVALMAVWLVLLLQISFMRGQQRANKYGEDPLPTPQDVRSDGFVTGVFAVLALALVTLPVPSYWYYKTRMNADGAGPRVESLDEEELAPETPSAPTAPERQPSDPPPPN